MSRLASRTIALPSAEPILAALAGGVAQPKSQKHAEWAEQRRSMERRRSFAHPDGLHRRWEGAAVPVAARALGLGMRLAGLYARGKRNALSPRLVERDFAFAGLPSAFDGYRILHLSDTHLDCLPELAEAAHRTLAGLSVDLVVVTGDIHGRQRSPLAHSTEPLARVLQGASWREPPLAVLGNHDPAAMVEALAQIGVETLINESRIVERAGQRLVLTGIDDVHYFYTPAARDALLAAPPGFRVALVHSAEIADHAAAAGYALYLCGHTHGGQICLPGGRSLFVPLKRCRFGVRGEWCVGTMIGYTSHGLGVGDVPLRFNCPSEMAVITLRRTSAGI